MTEKDSQVRCEDLLACPFCGGAARYAETSDGGRFVDCTKCFAASRVIYPDKTDPKPLLQEAWNIRQNQMPPDPSLSPVTSNPQEDAFFERAEASIGKANAELLACPWCKDTDFDAVGLKLHIINGHCDVFNELSVSLPVTRQANSESSHERSADAKV